MPASCLSEIAALTPNNVTLGPDGAIVLDWPAAPKTARADLRRASRFVRIRGQDAPDTTKLCGALRHSEKLMNPRTAQVERAEAPWNATARSIERGVLRHAARIVGTHNSDPHVIPQLAGHGGSFGLLQDTVRYFGRRTTTLTQVSSLAAQVRRETPRKDRNPG
ncbi:trans-sialidase [Trypanosoma cruzi]|nr:trans-sialidase [Trypanosoma cruzi]